MDDVMIEKVAKLLAKAERASTPEEAEAFFAKAFQLQAKYSLDEAVIHAKATGEVKPEAIIEKRVPFTGSYAQAQIRLGTEVGNATRCRVLQNKHKSTYTLYLIGYESDVTRAQTLIASLMIQAQRSLNQFARNIPAYYSAFEKFRERRDFWLHFSATAGDRMQAAERAAAKEYVSERVAAGDDEGALNNSMGIALRSRNDSMNDWVDHTYGKLRYTRTRMSGGFGHGANAGADAGSRADIGQSGVGPGGHKQLGR